MKTEALTGLGLLMAVNLEKLPVVGGPSPLSLA